MAMRKKKIVQRIIAGVLTAALVVQGGFYVPSVRAAGTDDTQVQDDVVSFRTVDNDIMIGTTINSPFSAEEISSGMALDTSLADQSHKVSTTYINTTELSNWYVSDHYDTKAYADKAAWVRDSDRGKNEALHPYHTYSESCAYNSPTYTGQILSVDEALEQREKDLAGYVPDTGSYLPGNVYYLKEHISASSRNGAAAMNFYGYGTSGQTDFLFYPVQEKGSKKVEYTINAREVKTHSLSQAGFLFNCGVTKNSDGADILSGYAMMFSFKDPVSGNTSIESTSGIQAIKVYKITDLPVDLLCNSSSYMMPTTSYFSNPYLTLIKERTLTEDECPFAGHFDVSNVSMNITSDSLKVEMTEAGEDAAQPAASMTLFDIQNWDKKDAATYSSAFTKTGYGGFGPIVAYALSGHSCQYTSYYIYSNLKMSIMESDSVLSGLSNTDYTAVKLENGQYVSNDKYFVLLGDNSSSEGVYRDCFIGNFDNVYLEMLKQQGVILITNLEITNQTETGLDGTNYNLEDYLGAGNVYHVDGDTAEELAEEIEKIISDREKRFSQEHADAAANALTAMGTAGEARATARCIVTYKGLQVDTVNTSRLPKTGITLAIRDTSINVGKMKPVYTIYYPNGSSRVLPQNTKDEEGNVTFVLRPEDTGIDTENADASNTCIVSVTYGEGTETAVSARTSFAVSVSYNSSFNDAADGDGTEEDHLYCIPGTVGVNQVKKGMDYTTRLIPDKGYGLPKKIEVRVVPEGSATGEKVLLAAGTAYTYDPVTGDIVVKKDYVTGNLYLYADTAKVEYDLTNITAGKNPVTDISSYDDNDLVVTLSAVPNRLALPDRVKVAIGGMPYEITYGEKPKDILWEAGKRASGDTIRGTVSYTDQNTGGTRKIQISKQFLSQNIKIEAIAGKFSVNYTTDQKDALQGADAATAVYGTDYNNVITADDLWMITDVSASLGTGQDVDVLQSCRFDPVTGRVHIDGDEITGDITIHVTMRARGYTVTPKVSNTRFVGNAVCDVTQNYAAEFQKVKGYDFPESVSVTVAGAKLTQGYTYNLGVLRIAKEQLAGNVEITAEGKRIDYPIYFSGENISFYGDTTGNIEESYRASIKPVDGYRLPDEVSVSVGEEKLERGTDYSYNAAIGELIINNGQIADEVFIEASADKIIKEYQVIYRLTNLTTDGKNTARENEDYIAKLRPLNSNYSLPMDFSITSGKKKLEMGVDYGYNGVTGVLTIPAESITGDLVIGASGKIIKKNEQNTPDVNKLTVIPPKYENSNDGKVIGVTAQMEYSIDGGKTWIPCKGGRITGLGTGTLSIRFYETDSKSSSPIATIEIESSTMEYYIPTIKMSKRMGLKKKFQIKIKNIKGAAVKVSSSDTSIAKVNKKGIITTKKKEGKAKIVLVIMKGKHIIQYVTTVTVKKRVKKNYSLKKFKTKYKDPSIALYKRLKKGKKWKVKMTHTKNAVISYRSTNTKVATVSKKGVVKGIRSGNTRICITVMNNGVIDKYFVVVRVYADGERSDRSFLKVIK